MLQHLARLGDASVTVDVLRTGTLRRVPLDLEGALLLLPTLTQLLASSHEE